MKYLMTVVFASLFLLTGCLGTVDYENVSGTSGYKEWIGKEFKLKKDIFIVSDPHYDKILFLMLPDPNFPSQEKYKAERKGGPKWNIFLDEFIVGVANKGNQYKIVAVGFYVFNSMIGRTGIVVVKDQDGREYYIREPGLFYFSWEARTLEPHGNYVEMLPAKVERLPDNGVPAKNPVQK